MKFRTEIRLASQQENLIDYQSKVLLLGSCFSENIGQKLSYYKLDTLVNPFGVLFNPVAIARVLEDTIQKKAYTQDMLVESSGLFHSLFHHSDLSALQPDEVLKHIHQAQERTLAFLKEATHVVVTLGTAWVYEYNKTCEIVANCHKISQKEFTKRILSLEEIQGSLNQIEKLLFEINPKIQLIYTVSPVRHIKDGISENNFSKSLLRVALGLKSELTKEQITKKYFPSYEIMNDDLRGYRFYEADLIHPNAVAIDYIWEQFSKVWISEKSQSYFKKIQSVQTSLHHRPFNPNSEQHQQFLSKLAIKKNLLEKELGIAF